MGDRRSSLADGAERIFDEAGGVVGRSASCDWVLPDETKTVSARHAGISFADGGFSVTDTSTNGVYLNVVDAPLGRGASARLSDGDLLYIGPYCITVEIVADTVDSRRRLGVDDGWKAVRTARGEVPPPSLAPEDLLAPRSAAQPGDPLAGLGRPPPRNLAPEPPRIEDPVAYLEAGAGPSDPEDDLLAELRRMRPGAPTPRREPPAAGPSPLIASPAPPPPPVPPLPAFRPAPAGTGRPEVRPAAPVPGAPASPPPPEPRLPAGAGRIPTNFLSADPAEPPLSRAPPPAGAPPPVPLPPSVRAAPPVPAAEPPPALDARALLRLRAAAAGTVPEASGREEAGPPTALLGALGLEPSGLSPEVQAAAVDQIAAFVIEAAEGLVAVLAARRSLRDELRLDRTSLGPVRNNPFKFFPNGREAVRRTLDGGTPGFKSLAAGAREGFDDIKAHELATLAAFHSVAAALLARLSPAAIEQSVDGGLFGRADKAKLWDRYVEAHGRILDTLDVSVGELLARELARAPRGTAGQEKDR